MSVVGPAEARPVDGLAVDFVVEPDRAQLRGIRFQVGGVEAFGEPAVDRGKQLVFLLYQKGWSKKNS